MNDVNQNEIDRINKIRSEFLKGYAADDIEAVAAEKAEQAKKRNILSRILKWIK